MQSALAFTPSVSKTLFHLTKAAIVQETTTISLKHKNNDEEEDDEENDHLDSSIEKAKPFNETSYGLDAITKTDFLKKILENASNEKGEDDKEGYSESALVKRRKKGGKNTSMYRTVDNRDSLPFEVRMSSPDPYTTGNQAKLQEKLNKNNKSNKKKVRKTDLSENSGIAADIYREGDDGIFQKVLGKFQLDKSTNCGDVLEIGEQNFEVIRARCQYKYAGGKQFVMIRKILEVKEVSRIAQEASLRRQFEQENLKNSTIHPSER